MHDRLKKRIDVFLSLLLSYNLKNDQVNLLLYGSDKKPLEEAVYDIVKYSNPSTKKYSFNPKVVRNDFLNLVIEVKSKEKEEQIDTSYFSFSLAREKTLICKFYISKEDEKEKQLLILFNLLLEWIANFFFLGITEVPKFSYSQKEGIRVLARGAFSYHDRVLELCLAKSNINGESL